MLSSLQVSGLVCCDCVHKPANHNCQSCCMTVFSLVLSSASTWTPFATTITLHVDLFATTITQPTCLAARHAHVSSSYGCSMVCVHPLQPQDRGEIAMWAEQWVNCAKQLNQWDILAEYARGIDNTSLQIDAMWRLRDWEQLRNTVKEFRESVSSMQWAVALIQGRAYAVYT